MQIETFKVFCDLAESGSFSKAAVANSVTQSAVSQQLRALEERYHVRLIERGRRNFALTAEGEAFLKASREIVGVYEGLDARFHSLRNVVAGEISIATIYSIGLHELPPFLKTFRTTHPGVEVRVDYRRSWEIYPLVLAGEVDMGFVSFPAKRTGLLIEPFLKDRLVMICHPKHALAERKCVALRELDGEKFIAFGPDLPTRKVIDRFFREQGVAVRHAVEFDNIETVKRAVEIENGISIVPANTITQEVENGTLAAAEIREPEMWRPLGILLKRNRVRTVAQNELLTLLQQGGNGACR